MMSEILNKFPRIQMEIQDASEPSKYYNPFDLEVVPTHVAERWIDIVGKEQESKIKQLEQEVKELKALQEKYVWVTREEMKAHSDIEQELSGKSLAQHDKEQVTFGATDFVGTVLEHGELCGHDSDFLVECKKEYIKQLQEQE